MRDTHRLQVVKAAEDNGWSRVGTPHYDVFHRTVNGQSSEVTVTYFEGSQRIAGARIGDPGRSDRYPARPGQRLADVLGWLNAPGG